ncbi:MAG: hypothetical protein H4O13_04855 [Xanthomonadales bacterium]|nr:hypothetical protein [Xanthomonadales bacterium]
MSSERMDPNPYTPPQAPLADHSTRSPLAAVVVGAAVGYGFAYVALVLISFGYFWMLTLQGVPQEELYYRALGSTAFLLFGHVAVCPCMMAGGYWSARLSPGGAVGAALSSAALVAALALLDMFAPFVLPIPSWSRGLSLLLPFPAFWLGALLWRRHRHAWASSRAEA